MRTTSIRLALLALLVACASLYVFALRPRRGSESEAQACPPGYITEAERERAERREQLAGGASEREREAEKEREEKAEKAREREHEEEGGKTACFTRKHPEPKGELMTRDTQASARVTAPAERLKPGAYAAAARDAQRLGARASSLPGAGGDWQPAGKGPLIDDDENYPEVAGQGLADLNGRVSDFATVPGTQRLFAAVGEGGVWASDDLGAQLALDRRDAPDAGGRLGRLQPRGGGTVFVLTGDNVFGGG